MNQRSSFSHRTSARVACAALCLWLLGACEDTAQPSSERGSGLAAAPAAAGAAAKKIGVDTLSFRDEDFVESERNRDPFRAYVSAFRSHTAEVASVDNPQRPVIMPNTDVEAMKLIAIISGMSRPKAMMTDPSGVGYVVERGDYIGRAKVMQTTGSVSMTLNWRVDRIRDNEVVLTRQDPTDPTRPPLSRIVTLRDEVAKRD